MSNPYWLSRGPHATADLGRCGMEWVAYLAGEPHSDSPVCVSPVLRAFCISFNDALDDGPRQRLRPYLARSIGTVGDGLDERRAWLATDWLVREYAPAWLDLAGLTEDADRLRALPPVLAADSAERSLLVLGEARKHANAVWDAARAAARNAAWAAALNAAGDAAGNAAGNSTAWAALAAALAAAAADAARRARARTVKHLQDSAFDLLDRMLPTEVVSIPVVADWRQVCGVA